MIKGLGPIENTIPVAKPKLNCLTLREAARADCVHTESTFAPDGKTISRTVTTYGERGEIVSQVVTYGDGLGQTEQGKVEELADDFERVTLHESRTPRKYYKSPSSGDSPMLTRDDSGSEWGVDGNAVSDGSVFN